MISSPSAFSIAPLGVSSFIGRHVAVAVSPRQSAAPRTRQKLMNATPLNGESDAPAYFALQKRISGLREELVNKNKRIARNWQTGTYSTVAIACLPGENFVRRVDIDAPLIACGTSDGSVCLFNQSNGDRASYSHANSGQTTAISVCGAYLASVGSADRAIVVWNIAGYRTSQDWTSYSGATFDGPELSSPVLRLSGHTSVVTSIQIDATRRLLYSASVDGSLKIWSLETGELVRSIHVGDPVLCMTCTGNYILIGCSSGRVRAYQAGRGLHLLSIQAHPSNTTSLYFDDITQTLATGSAGGAIKLWDFNSGRLIGSPPSHAAPVMALQLDETKVVSASRDGTIAVSSLKGTQRLYSIGGYTAFISSVSFDNECLIADGTNNLLMCHRFDK